MLGTSLAVQPFAGLVGKVGQCTPRLLINRERVGERGTAGGRGLGRPFDFERAQPHSISNDVLYLGEAFAVNPFGGSFQSWARRTSWWVEGPKGALSWCRVVPLFDLIRVIATHRPPLASRRM